MKGDVGGSLAPSSVAGSLGVSQGVKMLHEGIVHDIVLMHTVDPCSVVNEIVSTLHDNWPSLVNYARICCVSVLRGEGWFCGEKIKGAEGCG
ncbi:hypothetical protein ACOSQ3_014029 [Xanthoceras sorbifolium]